MACLELDKSSTKNYSAKFAKNLLFVNNQESGGESAKKGDKNKFYKHELVILCCFYKKMFLVAKFRSLHLPILHTHKISSFNSIWFVWTKQQHKIKKNSVRETEKQGGKRINKTDDILTCDTVIYSVMRACAYTHTHTICVCVPFVLFLSYISIDRNGLQVKWCQKPVRIIIVAVIMIIIILMYF